MLLPLSRHHYITTVRMSRSREARTDVSKRYSQSDQKQASASLLSIPDLFGQSLLSASDGQRSTDRTDTTSLFFSRAHTSHADSHTRTQSLKGTSEYVPARSTSECPWFVWPRKLHSKRFGRPSQALASTNDEIKAHFWIQACLERRHGFSPFVRRPVLEFWFQDPTRPRDQPSASLMRDKGQTKTL